MVKKILFGLSLGLILFPLLAGSAAFAQESSAEIEQAILNELNKVRNEPQTYIPRLEEYKKQFEGKNVNLNGRIYQTRDGVAAVDDAIKFLRKAATLGPLTPSEGLTKAARLQVADLGENLALGLIGKDGSTIPERAAKFGKRGKLLAANIGFYSTTAEDIVFNMIIDDGVRGRGNRKNIFNKTLQIVGIAFGRSKDGEPITLMVFADKFTETTK